MISDRPSPTCAVSRFTQLLRTLASWQIAAAGWQQGSGGTTATQNQLPFTYVVDNKFLDFEPQTRLDAFKVFRTAV